MIVSTRQTVRITASSIDWFLGIDILKISTAFFLLCIMLCILREDIAWRNAINSVQSSIAEDTGFTEHLGVYARLGEEWQLLFQLLTIAESIVGKLDDIKKVPLVGSTASAFVDIFLPNISSLIEAIENISRELVTIKNDLDFLLQTSFVHSATAQFQQNPNRESLIRLADSYRTIKNDLGATSTKLQNILPIAQRFDDPFTDVASTLENLDADNWFGIGQQMQALIDSLQEGAAAANKISDKISLYQAMMQKDASTTSVIIERVAHAQKIEAAFGNGVWRRLMNYVNANSILFMWANIALLMAEICLFIEHKNKV